MLVDVDSKIPNLALTKISTFHKERGERVKLVRLGLSGYPSSQKTKTVDAAGSNRLYVSTIFTHNKYRTDIINASETVFGGTGYDLNVKLPREIAQMPSDPTLYPDHSDTAYGFLTRGCPRKCPFCFVPKKEGRLRQESNIDDVISPNTRQVKFLDNNFLALPNHIEILEELVKRRGLRITFSQGLDIRCLTERSARLLDQLSYWEEYIFAFDNIKLEGIIEKKLAMLKRIKFSGRLKFFLFVSPKYTRFADDCYRIKYCISKGILPYVMRENRCWQVGRLEHRWFYVDIASWVNQPAIFKKMDFVTYLSKRHPKNRQRKRSSASIYYNHHPLMPSFWGDVQGNVSHGRKRVGQFQLLLFD